MLVKKQIYDHHNEYFSSYVHFEIVNVVDTYSAAQFTFKTSFFRKS